MNHNLSLLILLLLSSLVSFGQTRLYGARGLGNISETGFHRHTFTSFGIMGDFERTRVTFRTNVMTPKRISGQQDFTHCDSFVQSGWVRTCAPGHDSVVNSTFHNSFKKFELGADLLWRSDTNSRIWNGIGVDYVFFSKNFIADNRILNRNQLETGNALAFAYINTIDFAPFKKSESLLIHLKTRFGLIYSRQEQCTDVSCDNFFEKALQPYLSVQLGVSFSLN